MQEAAATLAEVGRRMNLAEHVVRNSAGASVRVPVCADVEIHRYNGRLFVLNANRLMPPAAPPSTRRCGGVASLFWCDGASVQLPCTARARAH